MNPAEPFAPSADNAEPGPRAGRGRPDIRPNDGFGGCGAFRFVQNYRQATAYQWFSSANAVPAYEASDNMDLADWPHVQLYTIVGLLASGLVLLLRRPAIAWGWVDVPCTRKHHPHPVPMVGGVAMWAAFCGGVLLLPVRPDSWPLLLVGLTLMTAVGLYDDIHSTRPATRLLFQGAIVLAAFLGSGASMSRPGDLFGLGEIELGLGALPFTLFVVIGVVNAYNMLDGLDGLAGGSALIMAGWLVALCLAAEVTPVGDAGALLVLAAAIAGFLAHNLRHPWRKRASVFMGDAGSTLLGFALAWFILHLCQGESAIIAPMTGVWILALPLLDTVTVMVRRMRAGRSPFRADRTHLHHILLARGLSDGRVTALMLLFSLISGGLGFLSEWLEVPDAAGFYSVLGIFILYYHFTTLLLVAGHRPNGSDRRRKPVPSSRLLPHYPWFDGSGRGMQVLHEEHE